MVSAKNVTKMNKSGMTFKIVILILLCNTLAVQAGLIDIASTKNAAEHVILSPEIIAYEVDLKDIDTNLPEPGLNQAYLENLYFNNDSDKMIQMPFIKITNLELISFNAIILND